MTGAIIPLISMLPVTYTFGTDTTLTCTPWKAYGCVMFGLWSGFVIGWVTERFTSNKYSHV
jgi:hypothetical protein